MKDYNDIKNHKEQLRASSGAGTLGLSSDIRQVAQKQSITIKKRNEKGEDITLSTSAVSAKPEVKEVQDKFASAVKKISRSSLHPNVEMAVSQQPPKESVSLVKKLLYTTVDKAVQFSPPLEIDPISSRDCNISMIAVRPLIFVQKAQIQSKEWTVITLNMILTDKLLCQVYDESDFRPCDGTAI